MAAAAFVLTALACDSLPSHANVPTTIQLSELTVPAGVFKGCAPPDTSFVQYPVSVRGQRRITRAALFTDANIEAESWSTGEIGGIVGMKASAPITLFGRVRRPQHGRVAFGLVGVPRYRDDVLKLIAIVDAHGC